MPSLPIRPLAFALLLAAACLPGRAAEQGAPSLARHGDWSAFADGAGADRLCWAATTAVRVSAALEEIGAKHGKLMVLFTIGKNEFSMVMEGEKPEVSEAALYVGDDALKVLLQDNWGWLESPAHDRRAHEAFLSAKQAELVIGDGSYEIGLDGFGEAARAAAAACP